jgi:hypothetical protein
MTIPSAEVTEVYTDTLLSFQILFLLLLFSSSSSSSLSPSPWCGVFAVVYLNQCVSSGCIVLHLFCTSFAVCVTCHVTCIPCWPIDTFTLALSEESVLCPIWLFSVILFVVLSQFVTQIFLLFLLCCVLLYCVSWFWAVCTWRKAGVLAC